MKKNILIAVLTVTTMFTCFLAGVYAEQRCSERREAFIREAIEDGDRVIFTDDGGIIKIHHNK